MTDPNQTKMMNAPVQDDETVTRPVTRRDTVRHKRADDQAPVQVTVDRDLDALTERSSRVLGEDSLGRLSDSVDCSADE